MIEIYQKSDIIIPYGKIGDNDWNIKAQAIISSLAENLDDEIAEPVSANEIDKLEEKLGTTLPAGLRLFYETFGLADIGESLQSFDTIEWIKNIWPQDQTPYYGPDFSEEDKVQLPYLITFSDYLGNGNMFCFHSETKEIYYFDHDERPYITRMFGSVDEYISGCLIRAQGDLFGKGVKQEQVEGWTEEILENLFGEDIVSKWYY